MMLEDELYHEKWKQNNFFVFLSSFEMGEKKNVTYFKNSFLQFWLSPGREPGAGAQGGERGHGGIYIKSK